MKKRITCLLAVLIVLVSCVPVSFAGYADTSDNFSSEVVAMLPSVLTGNINIDYFNDLSAKAFPDRNINPIPATDEVLISCSDSSSYGVKATYYYFLAENTVLDPNASQIPQVGSWIEVHLMADGRYRYVVYDEVNRSTQLRLEREWSYYTGDYTDGVDRNTISPDGIPPEYNLENDWLSQTTECGAYIIAPKSGKVWTSNDTKVNITVQYRIPSIDLGGGGSLGVNVLWYGVDSGGLPQGIAEWFTGPLDELSHDQKLEYDSGGIPRYMTGTVVFSGTMRKNMSMECYATVNGTEFESGGEIYETNHITMTHYDNFIDEDGDGKDDRDPDPDYNPGGTTDDNTDINGFGSILETLQAMKSTMNGVISFIGNYFRFIPSSIFALLGLGIGLVILLRVWGR